MLLVFPVKGLFVMPAQSRVGGGSSAPGACAKAELLAANFAVVL